MSVGVKKEKHYFAIIGDGVLAEYEPFVFQAILCILFTELHNLHWREIGSGSIIVGMKNIVKDSNCS
jgi:hypothetical protein